MTELILRDVSVDFPIIDPAFYSLKVQALRLLRLAEQRSAASFRALDNVSMHIRPGDRVGLYGPNGSGKTTLLRVIAGVYPPTSGSVSLTGKVSALLGLGAGAVPENSAEANIRMLLRIDGQEPNHELVNRIWEFTELDERFKTMPFRSLSSGMRMRILFAVATSTHAEAILLDEWLAVADASFSAKAEQRLQELIASTSILVIASHNHALLEKLCTSIITLDKGRISNTRP